MSWLSYLMIGAGIVTLANVIWLGVAALRLKRDAAKRDDATPVMVNSQGNLSLLRAERRSANGS